MLIQKEEGAPRGEGENSHGGAEHPGDMQKPVLIKTVKVNDTTFEREKSDPGASGGRPALIQGIEKKYRKMRTRSEVGGESH